MRDRCEPAPENDETSRPGGAGGWTNTVTVFVLRKQEDGAVFGIHREQWSHDLPHSVNPSPAPLLPHPVLGAFSTSELVENAPKTAGAVSLSHPVASINPCLLNQTFTEPCHRHQLSRPMSPTSIQTYGPLRPGSSAPSPGDRSVVEASLLPRWNIASIGANGFDMAIASW